MSRAFPTAPGFHWAIQIAVDPGTRDADVFEPTSRWEVVEVYENAFPGEPEHLRVFVLGVEEAQSLANFVWGPVIPPPPVIPPSMSIVLQSREVRS
ncbi:hypothetical protein [Brevundimonas aurantiaca]|jgi:hypothetical protein|uniref:hypothetical protein n=1 Tax=Brevundimonas aurantiaca TaxID=74316 RepID=UPI002FDDCEFE